MGQGAGQKDMSPDEFDRMIRSTGFNSSEINEVHDRFIKQFPKGYMDKSEFRAIYSSLFPQGSGADQFAEHIFRIYDQNGDGRISFQEFIMTLRVSTHGSLDEKLRSSFRMYDVDHSGFITERELTDILSVTTLIHLYLYFVCVCVKTAHSIVCCYVPIVRATSFYPRESKTTSSHNDRSTVVVCL